MSIYVAESKEEVENCYTVMRQLRPHLTLRDFVSQVHRQQADTGYRIAYVEKAGRIVAVAGYLFRETLADGYFLNVDDLVTEESSRSQGHGAALLNWLHCLAAANESTGIQLDSGVQRIDAHRFYEREGYKTTAYHYTCFLQRSTD